MIWQGEKNHSPDRKLSVMYWPVVGTLLEGFRHAEAGVEILLGVGFSLAYHAAIGRLRREDVLLWVGTNGKLSQPWRKLRNAGVRTVYYNTEPMYHAPCDRYADTVDELWDFSYFNLERCAQAPMRPKTLRFIPPGFLREHRALTAASPPLPLVAGSNGGGSSGGSSGGNGGGGSGGDPRLSLVFFGLLDRLHGQRRACYLQLKERLGSRLVQRYDVWNESAFDALMASSEIFLNLHKFCTRRHPVTFRNAVLLNAKKLLLSERAHCLDEREYAGMMTFVDVPDLAATYERLIATDWRAAQRLSHERFERHFAPRALFARAAVYRDWKLSSLPSDAGVASAAANYIDGERYASC